MIFKELATQPSCANPNELEAVKFAITRSLASLSHGKRGKYINIKNISLDLPLSPLVFQTFFPVDYSGNDGFKDNLSVDELSTVFGENWHIYNFCNSSTRKRIIGLVLLHFRRKTIKLPADEIDNDIQQGSFWLQMKFQAVKENIQVQDELSDINQIT